MKELTNLPVPQVRRWTNHVERSRARYFRRGTEPQWYLDAEKYLEDRELLISERRLLRTVTVKGKVTRYYAKDVFTKPKGIDTTPVYEYSYKSTTSSKICKCFGGPLNGQSIPLEDAREAKYAQFNMGTTFGYGNKNYHSAVLVYLPEVTI